MKKILVTGAGGFIGSHMVKHLKDGDYWVRGVDIKEPEFMKSCADEFVLMDLRNKFKTQWIRGHGTEKDN